MKKAKVRNSEKIPKHLPERLTISFTIWGLFNTDESGVYFDIDKMVKEHVERGFNCIRLDSGAGFIHDIKGNLRSPVIIGHIFGEDDACLRQFNVAGKTGYCNLHDRLIELFKAAKKYNVFIILSSWYYLHTLWFIKEPALNAELHSIAPMERFQAFAKFLHYILLELEELGLDSQVAFAEIFNESDGLRFVDGYNENHLSDEEIAKYRAKHEEAIQWLKELHPQILFAFDSYTPRTDLRQVTRNMQVYNFHNYFMWSLYGEVLENDNSFLVENKISKEEIMALAESDYLPDKDWYHRAWYYANLDKNKIPAAQDKMKNALKENMDAIREEFYKSLDHVNKNLDNNLPAVPVVCGEGVTYSGGYNLVWEETSEEYWTIVKEVMLAYREAGLWGTVIRTCCGPEDPVWNMCPEKLLEMNNTFLIGKE